MRRLLLVLLGCLALAAGGCNITPDEDPGYHIRLETQPRTECETS